MKKLIKSMSIFSLVFALICSSFVCNPVHAAEPRSGGLVSIVYTHEYSGNITTTVEEYPLSPKHYHNPSDQVSSTLSTTTTKTVTSTLTTSLEFEIIEDLKHEVGYGVSYSSASESNNTFTVTKKGYHQIFYKVTYEEQDVTQVATATYYDTAVGYYTRTTRINSHYKIPKDAYIYCKYTAS